MSRIGRIIFYGVVALILLATFVIIFGVEGTKQIQTQKDSNGVNIGMTLMYILLGMGVLGMLAIAVKGMIDKPKSAIRTALGLGVMLLMFLIGYLIDGGTTPDKWREFGIESSGTSKAVGGALIMMYLTLFGGLLLAVFGPFLKYLRK